jgi:acyl-coenzyme A synthetase/AMP-(fatty) acid ligase
MLFALDAINRYLRHKPDDVVMSALPVAFSYGLYQVLTVFASGGALALESSFAYPAVMLQRISEERVTGLPGVPTMFSILSRMDLSLYDLSSLRYMTNAAAALPPSHLQDLKRQLPALEFFSMHGLTEVARTVFLSPEMSVNKPASVGKAIPGTEVWLEDEGGRRVGPGETGELIVRGRHVMRGYWKDPEGSAERFRPGPLPGERVCHSGDLFRMDEDGDLYFVSRKDDIIKTRGEKVSPREVENAICTMQGVIEAAVIGAPDPLLGQAIKAFVVCGDKALTAAQVQSHCRAHLEEFMIPRYVVFLDELPKTASGKILKSNLA